MHSLPPYAQEEEVNSKCKEINARLSTGLKTHSKLSIDATTFDVIHRHFA